MESARPRIEECLRVRIGLDQADQVASVIGAFAGVLGLLLTIRYARGHRSAPARAGRPGRDPADTLALVTGIVGALFGLLTVAACGWGVVWAVRAAGPDGDEPGAGNAQSSPGATATAGQQPAAAPGRPPPPPPVPVLWRGEIRLGDKPRDFDTEPPAQGNFSIDLQSDAYLNGDRYTKYMGGSLVLWPGRADPDRDGCANRLATHGDESVSVARGSRVCLSTNHGRIVYLKILKRDGAGYTAMVTIWPGG
jgi:hypothetical protein